MFKKFFLKGQSILLPLPPPRQNLLCRNYIIASDIMYNYYMQTLRMQTWLINMQTEFYACKRRHNITIEKVFLINFVFVHDIYILAINFSAFPARAFLFYSLFHYFFWRGGCVYVYPCTAPPPPFPAFRQLISCILGPYLQMSKVTWFLFWRCQILFYEFYEFYVFKVLIFFQLLETEISSVF